MLTLMIPKTVDRPETLSLTEKDRYHSFTAMTHLTSAADKRQNDVSQNRMADIASFQISFCCIFLKIVLALLLVIFLLHFQSLILPRLATLPLQASQALRLSLQYDH